MCTCMLTVRTHLCLSCIQLQPGHAVRICMCRMHLCHAVRATPILHAMHRVACWAMFDCMCIVVIVVMQASFEFAYLRSCNSRRRSFCDRPSPHAGSVQRTQQHAAQHSCSRSMGQQRQLLRRRRSCRHSYRGDHHARIALVPRQQLGVAAAIAAIARGVAGTIADPAAAAAAAVAAAAVGVSAAAAAAVAAVAAAAAVSCQQQRCQR